jgi:hypothetical protein
MAPEPFSRRAALAAALVFLLGAGAAPLRADDWKYDVVVLKETHKILKGLLVNYTDDAPLVELRVVIRKPGERTRLETHLYERKLIDSVEQLDDKERALLGARIKALDITGKELAERIRKLPLERIDWGKNGKKNAFRYEGTHFTLEANVREELFRRFAVRLAQVYNAYARYLPPRYHSAAPTTVLLAGSLADYQALLKERGYRLSNPAFYDPARNLIVCGSDLERLGLQLDGFRQENERLRQGLKEREAELAKLYKGKAPGELLRPVAEARRQIERTEAANDRAFEEARRALLQRLYHEAFHAYLANFVYPPGHDELPRWLNEGLAQIFETALFEGDEVRIGHADPERLRRAQVALAMNELVPLTDLLRSTSKHFVVAHDGDRQTSDRYYLTSWALASYLAFDRKVLGTRALDAYARATFRNADPVEAFCDLLSEGASRLPQVEKEFRSYLQHLRPNGSVARSR